MTTIIAVLINKPFFFIVVTCEKSLLLLALGAFSDDGSSRHFEKRFIGTLDNITRVADFFDSAD